jgi:hypothetical protein
LEIEKPARGKARAFFGVWGLHSLVTPAKQSPFFTFTVQKAGAVSINLPRQPLDLP